MECMVADDAQTCDVETTGSRGNREYSVMKGEYLLALL
jgi:hypothetical protein